MPTVAREIDALGGSGEGAYHAGFIAALDAADPIAEAADALIEDLLEAMELVLTGGEPLHRWADRAYILVHSARERRAR